MNFLKIIFLLGLFINDSYASTFVDFHSHLPTLSWRQHWLEALGKMEGTSGALSKEYRQDLLQRFFAGFGKNPRKDAEASLREAVTESGRVASDLNTKRYLVFDNFVRRWKNSPYISATTNMDEILESGLIPISSQYSHNARDRRWTAGWLLDVMDIIRQQGFLQPAFHAPFDDVYNNDLLKVRELSGTFWKWNGNPAEINQAKELFSGMIQPSQNIKGGSDNPNTTVNIISCFQGLWNQRMEEIYFLPKGEAPTPNNFFRVVSIKVGDGRFLDQDEVDIVSQRWNEDEWGELFQEDDYAIIKVQNLSKSGGKTLRNILQDKNLLSGNRVITLTRVAFKEEY